MKIALISFSADGAETVDKIICGLNRHSCQHYVFLRGGVNDSVHFDSAAGNEPVHFDSAGGNEPVHFDSAASNDPVYFDSAGDLIRDIFYRYDGLVFACACGIAVRLIAPYIGEKTTDPAVVVTDEQGRFSISLLSGHLGGANALAKELAAAIGAEPVITTATDIGGRFSPDSFAKENHLYIDDMTAAKHVAAAVLRGEEIGFVSDYPLQQLPSGLCPVQWTGRGGEPCTKYPLGIYISEDEMHAPFSETLHLIPRNLVLGTGCKKNILPAVFEQAVLDFLAQQGFSVKRLRCICSIDLKRDEQGILDFSRKYRVPFYTFPAEQLNQVEGTFSSSEFVREVTGVDNVCERSAMMYGGTLVAGRQAGNGITLALARLPVNLKDDYNHESME